ncbi:PVC-type heme-binding CxxCH protein [Opitutus sp. GAS368]|uniref:PVC-type heme-binding CxxCH protein n=1 Tax=Opitutus sp. GAS368 TaxID=1882749 RepID=UPI00087BD21F|nr:PVC-type heme-binding CxxCH protein [Opitutus sp. GAS368]SDS00796.1 putative membrane-bound dehydrogenase domain-containing protein [Opitutus sp. GAS368]
MLFHRLLPLALLLTTAPLLAQHGDKPGEAQQAVPGHIKTPPAPVLVAEEALKTLKVAPGFRVEIAAADPLVGDPVAMTFGPDGRIWVVEMRGFMRNADGKGEMEKVGTISVLEDTDGDGRYNKRTVFLDKLVLPRAVALVGDGVLVAEPPHLWFCRDTNGDGVADEKTEVFSDYGGTSNPEHTANGLMWGLDNWIYNANHTQRFRYLGNGKFASESTLARGQWGLSQDDTGRIFHNSNSDPLRADLVPTAYLRRNPFLTNAAGGNVQLAPADLPIWPGRVTPGVNRGYKSLNAEGKITAVTAACGPLVYRSGLFPAEFYNNAFFVEPAGNLVKRMILTEADGTITARNAYEGSEFITSTDERFRPVNTANGPDGALYIVDMYRGIIQHRIYMTTFLRKQVEERGLADGIGMGRIYRIMPETAVRSKVKFNLATESSAQLVTHLRAANSWWRDTAQRLLVERRDPAAAPLLREMVRSGPPLARLHALWTLDGSGQLDRDTILAGLGSTDARVVAAAIRLSEPLLAKGDDDLYRRVADVDAFAPNVTLQLALSLGEAKSPEALAALVGIAERAGRQPYIADAIVSGLAGREFDFITRVLADPKGDGAAPVLKLAAGAVFKSGDTAHITGLLAGLDPKTGFPDWGRAAVLDGLERFLPKTPEGKLVAGNLPVEPRALLLLSVQGNTPEGKQAARLAGFLKWPGKPGLEKESADIAARLTPEQKVLFDKGRITFATICAACHQAGGEGMAGLAPQLLYSKYVLGNERQLARIVLNGKEKEGLAMPPLRALDDETIAGALTYVRQSWGHNAPPVSPATIAEVRKAVGDREAPWSEEELQTVP